MKIFLDNMHDDILTDEQRKALIEDAEKWNADYLIYAITENNIDYFLYGNFKDLRPRFSGIPRFVYMDNNKIIKPNYSVCAHLTSVVDIGILNISSSNQ